MSDQPVEECKCEKGAPKWVVTFGDMMSLLLTFFVLLLSFSTTEVVKYKRMAGSIKEAFGVAQTSPDHTTPAGEEITIQQIEIPKTMAQMATVRAKAARHARKQPKVEMNSGADWFRIQIDGDALFDTGQITIKPEAAAILDGVAPLINDFDGVVKVEGHTDTDRGVRTRFDSGSAEGNYELAGLRAIVVMDYFFKNHNVDRNKMVPVAMGEFKPRGTNLSEDGKARNRRVEFEFVAGSKAEIQDTQGSFVDPD
ncbi:MAG: flagellar motor protein MotB [Acidobacteriota bacterium]|nr:flagellar motor protein MotB [Acidobacteriota bacterium]